MKQNSNCFGWNFILYTARMMAMEFCSMRHDSWSTHIDIRVCFVVYWSLFYPPLKIATNWYFHIPYFENVKYTANFPLLTVKFCFLFYSSENSYVENEYLFFPNNVSESRDVMSNRTAIEWYRLNLHLRHTYTSIVKEGK